MSLSISPHWKISYLQTTESNNRYKSINHCRWSHVIASCRYVLEQKRCAATCKIISNYLLANKVIFVATLCVNLCCSCFQIVDHLVKFLFWNEYLFRWRIFSIKFCFELVFVRLCHDDCDVVWGSMNWSVRIYVIGIDSRWQGYSLDSLTKNLYIKY